MVEMETHMRIINDIFDQPESIPVLESMKEPPVVEWLVIRGSFNLHALSNLDVVGNVSARTETEANHHAMSFLRQLMTDQTEFGLDGLLQPGSYWVCRKPSEAIFTLGIN